MKENNESFGSLKRFAIIILSVGAGTYVSNNVLEPMNMNMWVSKGGGAVVAGVVCMILWKLLIKKAKTDTVSKD